MNRHFIALETSSSLCSVALLSCVGDEVRCLNRAHEGVGEHAQRLLPMVDSLLHEARISRSDLTAVAFGRGPGGFTGLRVACGVAQGMAFALGVPVLPVTSLLAVVQRDFWSAFGQAEPVAGSGGAPHLFVAIQDARMGEVYLAAYESAPKAGGIGWLERQEPILIDAAQARAWLRLARDSWSGGRDAGVGGQRTQGPAQAYARVCGDALQVYPSILTGEEDEPWLERGTSAGPDAAAVAYLARDAWDQGLAVSPESAAPLYVRDKIAYTTMERESGLGGNPKAGALLPLVEPMSEADLDAVAQLEQDLQFAPWSLRNFSDGLQAGYGGWIVRRAGRILGYCLVMFAPDVAQLLVLGVSSDVQRQGIGRHLLRHVEKQARLRKLPAVMLEVRPSNSAALQLYGKAGFQKVSERRGYYPAADGLREDAYVLRKELNESEGGAI